MKMGILTRGSERMSAGREHPIHVTLGGARHHDGMPMLEPPCRRGDLHNTGDFGGSVKELGTMGLD